MGFSTFADVGSDDDYLEDDNVVEKGLDERMFSVQLKNRMNYMTNAIRETLDYDTELATNFLKLQLFWKKL